MGKYELYSNPASLLSLASLESAKPSTVSFRVRLRQAADEVRKQTLKPFDDQISQICGCVEEDGIERISSHQLAAALCLEAKDRTPATWRILAAAMARHGWNPTRFRGVGPSGGREQVRGFARPARY